MTTAVKNTASKTSSNVAVANQQTTTSSSSTSSTTKRFDDISSHRESAIQQRQRDAAESKARTLQMYDNMAKSGAAGDTKALDINTYRGRESGKLLLSGAAIQKRDFVEETIRDRVRASEENKKRLLAAFDYAAKTQPSGTVRDVDFESFKGVDGKFDSLIVHFRLICFQLNKLIQCINFLNQLVSSFESDKPAGAATFRSSNGVPNVVKG